MKKILIVIVVLFLTACNNDFVYDYVIVSEVSLVTLKEHKYKVGLDFAVSTQYLYTNEIYNAGDTLYFLKK